MVYLCSTYFQRIKSKHRTKMRRKIDWNRDKNSNNFTFSILFANYKREEVEIRHVPYCYEKTQLPSLVSTQLVFFDNFQIKQVSGPPTTIRKNEYNVFSPRYEEGKVDVEICVYDTTNQQKRATFHHDQEGRFCLGVRRK